MVGIPGAASTGGVDPSFTRPVPDDPRERVRCASAQAWREPVSVLHLGRGRQIALRFDVEGLRRDGTRKGEESVHRFLPSCPAECGGYS